MSIAIYGPGGFGREVASFLRRNEEVVFVSDDPGLIGSQINDLPVISFEQLIDANHQVCLTVADANIRRHLAERCSDAGLGFANAWASDSVRGDNVQLGDGSVLCGLTICTTGAQIGQHFHANIYSYVAHDCVVGDFVTLAPRACINGNTIIEDDVYIGTGAILRQGTPEKPLRIGRGAIVGMGAVVTKDVPPGTTVVGSPARPLER